MTTPTVGRVVYFEPLPNDPLRLSSQPYRADICHVNDDGTVNLSVNDHRGNAYFLNNIAFVDAATSDAGQAHWMPYQVATAAAAAPAAPAAPTA